MIFRYAGKPVVWGEGHGESGGPATWRLIVLTPNRPKIFAHDMVYATCPNGHECRLVSDVHRIAADGTLSPSYVCPVPGCTFHTHVRLADWPQEVPA